MSRRARRHWRREALAAPAWLSIRGRRIRIIPTRPAPPIALTLDFLVRDTLKSNNRLGVAPPVTFDAVDPLEAYKHFLPHAQALSSDTIEPCTVDIALARHNIERALAAIEPHHGAIRPGPRSSPLPAILELPALAIGLASRPIASPPPPRTPWRKHLERLRFMRSLALRQLEIFAYLDLVPEARVQALRVGPTSSDTCHEAVAIVAPSPSSPRSSPASTPSPPRSSTSSASVAAGCSARCAPAPRA